MDQKNPMVHDLDIFQWWIQDFPKNYMKLKEFGSGGMRPSRPLDPPMYFVPYASMETQPLHPGF